MMMGTNAKMLFEYPTMTYSATPAFWSSGANGPHGSPHGAKCASCHAAKGSKHSFEITLGDTVPTGTWEGAYPLTFNSVTLNKGDANTFPCAGCHKDAYSLNPKIDEFDVAAGELLAAIQAYATVPANLAAIKAAVPTFNTDATKSSVVGQAANVTGICYNGAANPYFFFEVSGVCYDGLSAGAPTLTASFNVLNPALLKAGFNYQWTQKEPGAWAHNEFYVMQAIYDSIVAVGGTPSFKVAAVMDNTVTPAVPKAGDPLNRGY